MSKTHRRLSRTVPLRAGHFVGRTGRRDAAAGTTVDPAALPVPPIRVDLQTLFDDEPEVCLDGCGDVWRLMGLNPDTLCTGADGLVRLTVG